MSVVEQDESAATASRSTGGCQAGGRSATVAASTGGARSSRCSPSTSSTRRSGTCTTGTRSEALRHAHDIIRWQKSLGINHEQAIQEWALASSRFIIASNYFYGSLHFIVTIGVMIFLFRK